MVYDQNSRSKLFRNLPAKINDVIWWDPLVSYSFLNFSYHFFDIIWRSNTLKDLKSTKKELYEAPVPQEDDGNLPSGQIMSNI
jgi:hypothetical protein